MSSAQIRNERALNLALEYGQVEGDHHRAWVIDQMVRALTGEAYGSFIAAQHADGGLWDEGIAP